MVRRAASQHLSEFAKVLDAAHVATDVMPLAEKLAVDDQDSVRLLSVDTAVALSGILSAAVAAEKLLPVVVSLTEDRSWRVRWSVASKFTELCTAFGPEVTAAHLVDCFEKLLGDSEAEVRTAAAARVTDVAERIKLEQTMAKLLPSVTRCVWHWLIFRLFYVFRPALLTPPVVLASFSSVWCPTPLNTPGKPLRPSSWAWRRCLVKTAPSRTCCRCSSCCSKTRRQTCA